MMFKSLAQKLSNDRERLCSAASNPITVDFECKKKLFLKNMTESALNLYERQSDIKKFTKLVLSDPENKTHDKLVEAIFSHGIVSVEDNKSIERLSDNPRLLRDLGLTEES